MRKLVAFTLLATTVCTSGMPQQATPERKLKSEPQQVASRGKNLDLTSLFETDKWKKLLVRGRVGEVVEYVEKALGIKNAVETRTQWGNEFNNADEVRNTVKWSAWKSNKTNLNLIVDSKVAQRNGKIDFMGPNFGLSFQLKY